MIDRHALSECKPIEDISMPSMKIFPADISTILFYRLYHHQF